MKKKLLVIGTGGTIASKASGEGLAPETDVLDLLGMVPEAEILCDITCVQLMSLDSTDIGPKHWLQMAACIRREYEQYDAFLILHGTDTMAYTAAALSYLLQNSRKPIVLTGSQKPMEDEHTDAKGNILDAVAYAIHPSASDVTLVFGGKVIPGGRARKVCTLSGDAFACVGYQNRALIRGGDVTHYLKKVQREPFACYDSLETKVLDFKITPGLNPQNLLPLFKMYEGVVLEGFGLGGFPECGKKGWFSLMEDLLKEGRTVAVTTQVPEEGSDMSVYEVGRKYRDNLLILEGKTMTPEAMTVKLMWILGRTKEPEKVRELFYKSVNYDLI